MGKAPSVILQRYFIDRGIIGRIILMIIRFGERGNPSDKIRALERTIEKIEVPVQ